MKILRNKGLLLLSASLLVFSLGAGAADDLAALCEPPKGDESLFANAEHNRNNVAARCVSAYPRFDNYIVQSAWEAVVLRGCMSQYAVSYNQGRSDADYKTACMAAEESFRAASARWHDNRVIDRAPSPVCSSTVESGPDGQKLYACTIHYSSEKYRNPARPLSEADIVIDN